MKLNLSYCVWIVSTIAIVNSLLFLNSHELVGQPCDQDCYLQDAVTIGRRTSNPALNVYLFENQRDSMCLSLTKQLADSLLRWRGQNLKFVGQFISGVRSVAPIVILSVSKDTAVLFAINEDTTGRSQHELHEVLAIHSNWGWKMYIAGLASYGLDSETLKMMKPHGIRMFTSEECKIIQFASYLATGWYMDGQSGCLRDRTLWNLRRVDTEEKDRAWRADTNWR